MKVYIQSNERPIPCSYNLMNAYQGFYEMGFEVIPFYEYGKLKEIGRAYGNRGRMCV